MPGKSLGTQFEYQIEAQEEDGTWAKAYPMNFTTQTEMNTTLDIMKNCWPTRAFRRVEVEITRRAMDIEPSLTRQERAHRRDDFHVNSNSVLCAKDGCPNRVHRMAGEARHPWDKALEVGWELLWPDNDDSTDLLCEECAPKQRKWVADFEAKRALRELALGRNDEHVGPNHVHCMVSECTAELTRDSDQHPWDVARRQGWQVFPGTTELRCPQHAVVR